MQLSECFCEKCKNVWFVPEYASVHVNKCPYCQHTYNGFAVWGKEERGRPEVGNKTIENLSVMFSRLQKRVVALENKQT